MEYEPIFYRMWNGTHDVCFEGDSQGAAGQQGFKVRIDAG